MGVLDNDEMLTVGEVAQTFGVTVRTLHHYDEIGLLSPSERSHAGYRLYTGEDLERLATIVTYRRLDLPLDEVAALLRGDGSTLEHLKRQRDAVMEKVEELHELVDAIDRALEREMNEQPATTEDLKEIFGDGFKDEYQAEAQERWGDTDAWKQSSRRTKGYTKSDWERIKAEMESVGALMVAAKRAGEPATSEAAMDAAEAARLHIDTWFYECSPEFHRNLGDLYVGDPRFMKTYEDQEPGLAQYTRDAIHANADRHA
ncbi:transcriptional regulator [Knoellia subterranea KCTC 19937]|uniref:Transcriptional regulator n=1 Tax=Knoellia subterranea KCTC 19937 TaxID=1385521 RepID=A0A0A0JRC1_9MICO|nr:transcriptional regulator [Knoellia subterranea KCTC 19937]